MDEQALRKFLKDNLRLTCQQVSYYDDLGRHYHKEVRLMLGDECITETVVLPYDTGDDD